MRLLKRLTGLMAQKAKKKQYWLELGVHFLEKGSKYKVGQIISKKMIGTDRYYVTYIAALSYDFETNRINHQIKKRIVSLNDIAIEKSR